MSFSPGAAPPAANWYPDPYGRFQTRYWDGTQWTANVANNGQQASDPVPQGGAPAQLPVPVANHDPMRVQGQVQGQAGVAPQVAAASHSIFDQPVLVVNQKTKLIEVQNEYFIFDQNGTQIGAVREIGQGIIKKAIRLLGQYDQFFTHRLQVVDMGGQVLLNLTRPAKFFKSQVIVANAAGQEMGRIRQRNMIGKIKFGLEVNGQDIGSINAENWRAWNFSIQDGNGQQIGRVTKTWEGLLKTMFTTADNYVVQMQLGLPEPLRSMVIASALCIDTALKQDDRGINII